MYKKLLPVLLLLCFFTGCFSYGPFKANTQVVEGIVLLDGEPIADAIIKFVPSEESKETGELATGLTNANGKFDLTSLYGNRGRGALQGTYKVIVSKEKSDWVIDKRTGEGYTVATQLLPAIYQDETKTPLEVTVKKGKNKVTLELQSK